MMLSRAARQAAGNNKKIIAPDCPTESPMLRLVLLAVITISLAASLDAAPEPPKTASSGSRASAHAGASPQAATKPPPAAASSGTAGASTSDSAQPKAAASGTAGASTINSAHPKASAAPATATPVTPPVASSSTPSSNYIPLASGSSEFHLQHQIRGNLVGFDCNSLVSDIASNPAFALVTRLNLAESRMSDSCAAQVFSLLHKMPLVHHINCHRCAVSSAGVAALAKHLSSGSSKVSFIDLIWNDLSDSDVQALADSIDNIPYYVMIHTDHNPKCNNANGILRECKNHKAETRRIEEHHAAVRAAEARATAEAAAAASKKQKKSDKSAADSL